MLSEAAKWLVTNLTKNDVNVNVSVMLGNKYSDGDKNYKMTKEVIDEVVNAGHAKVIYEGEKFVNLMGIGK